MQVRVEGRITKLETYNDTLYVTVHYGTWQRVVQLWTDDYELMQAISAHGAGGITYTSSVVIVSFMEADNRITRFMEL